MNAKGSSKGQLFVDLPLFILILFIFAVGSIVAMLILSNINTEVQADADISATAKASLQQNTTTLPTTLDNIVVFMLVLFWVLLLVSSFMIDSHPVFFIIMFILLIVVLVIIMVIGNTYQDLAADSDLSSTAALFPMTGWIFQHILLTCIVIGMSALIALYAKRP